jgi:predicted permease
MIRTFAGLHTVKPGFDPSQLLTFKTSLNGGRYDTTAQAEILERNVLERLESLPGVRAAACAFMLPLEQGLDMPFAIEGRAPAQGKWEGDEFYRPAIGRYFEALRIPLLRGRLLDQRDSSKAPRVVVINDSFARKYWKTGDPLGQRITIGHGLGADFEEGPREIVGIVANVREVGLDSGEVAVMYLPTGQLTNGVTKLANNLIPASWIVRTQTDPLTSAAAIQSQLLAIDPQLSMLKVRTMEKVMVDSTTRQNFNMLLLTVFASVALLLASIGIYGLLAYTVQQRTQEIGIRMALGANRSNMMQLVLRQGFLLVGIGIVLGLAASYGLTRLLSGLLFGVKASDPATFAAVTAVLALVAFVAALIPARRATRIDPVIAIRAE